MNQGPAFAMAFYGFAALTLLGAAWVAFLGNIVRSAFALLATFVGVAGLYVLLSADLVAIIQLMVYVGGVLVVILFAVMLTARIQEISVSNRSLGRGPAVLLLAPLVGLLAVASLRLQAARIAVTEGQPTTRAIGDALLGPYVLPFEVISLLLLAALLGAVVLSRGWGTLGRTPVRLRQGVAGSPGDTDAGSVRKTLRVLQQGSAAGQATQDRKPGKEGGRS